MDAPVQNDWRDAYEAFKGSESAAQWGTAARDAAFARFEAHGLPTKRDEYWKYTPVRDVTPHLGVISRGEDNFAKVDAYRIVFVDGHLDASRSDRDALEKIVEIAGADAEWMNRVYAELQGKPVEGAQKQIERPFADLNMAFATDGLAMRVPAGIKLDKPIHFRYEGDHAAHLRFVILIEKGAEATILESGAGALTTGAEVVVEDDATLHHLRTQNEVAGKQFTALYARLGERAVLRSFTLATDGDLIRNETMITLAGEYGSGNVAAGVMGRNHALIDNTVFVSHEAPHCESRQVIKNIMDGDSRAVFQGKIYVQKDAQKTDGYQISQSVLLSERAEFNAKPELEIYADDVMCSHGSTTGALDERALFYLRSRGVTQFEAEALLVAAFADEAILEIADESLQEVMRNAVSRWMAARKAA